MRKIVECVPNFSEGRDAAVIEQITAAISAVEGVTLLDVDPGKDTNRTVVTLVGEPEAVKEAAFRGIQKAAELIDMSSHAGAHPRMGATDVCPFIPVANMTMEECIQLAHELGERVGKELGIPVYCYEYAAKCPERRNLADIRKGEYEALPEKMKNPSFKPDFGPAQFNAKTGATVIGARDFLVAYNVNLNTRDKKLAHEIALTIRESGCPKKDKHGNKVIDKDGNPVIQPGLLQCCKAVGWYIDEYGYAQVSINLTNYTVTGIHHAFDAVTSEAQKRGLRVTGSEVVGLVPKKSLIDAGIHYLQKQGKNIGIPEREMIHIAILSLGLNDTVTFDPDEKIIEYRINKGTKRLVDMTLTKFADELSSDSPAPGGGSVAALCGALSASLSSMVANLTYGKKGYERVTKAMTEVSVQAQELKRTFLELIDRDTDAFNTFMAASKMPRKTDEQKAEREKALQAATKHATMIPLETVRASVDIIRLAEVVSKKGNAHALSDAAVAAIMAESAAESAYLNVKINVPGITDKTFVADVMKEANELLKTVKNGRKRIVAAVSNKL